MSCEWFHASIFYCLKWHFWRVWAHTHFPFMLWIHLIQAGSMLRVCSRPELHYLFCSVLSIFLQSVFVGPMFALVVLSCVNLEVINNCPFSKIFAVFIIHFRIDTYTSFTNTAILKFLHSRIHARYEFSYIEHDNVNG